MLGLAALAVLCATAAPARAQEQVKIGIGFGLAFLPLYICQDLKLVEKRAKELHLDIRASYQRFLGAGPMQDGKDIMLQLTFADAGTITVIATVTNPQNGGSSYFLN